MPTIQDPSFPDQMGVFFDRLGQPRMAGRLFGHLLICEPAEQSAAQLQEALGASTGSVNSMLRLLVASGFVDRRGERGGKRLWYNIPPGAFSRVLAQRLQLVSELKHLAETGIGTMNEHDPRGDRLREMRDCYAFFEREFPLLVERYEHEIGDRR